MYCTIRRRASTETVPAHDDVPRATFTLADDISAS